MTVTMSMVSATVAFFVARIGNPYLYGGMFSPTNTSAGTDCSGCADTLLRILTTGSGGPVDGNGNFIRTLDTESWPYNYTDDLAVPVGTVGPYGSICAGDAQPGPAPTVYPPQIPSGAAAIIYLMHGGGGENSHVMIGVNDGTGSYIVMETGGGHNDTGGDGPYASPNGQATATDDPEWTDIWYIPGDFPSPPPPVLSGIQQNALTVINVGAALGVTPLGQQMALCCALDEGGMLMWANSNVPESLGYPHDAVGNNANSCGPFQQQYDQGWGTVAQEMTWEGSATLFYNALTRLAYNSGAQPVWMYIQNVQGSATPDGSNYQAQWANAVALYNSVINAPSGDDMAAVPQAQWDELFAAVCGPAASQASFRQLDEGAIWQPNQFWGNDDGMSYDQYIAWRAAHGDAVALAVLAEIAAADVTKYAAREDDIRLAQNVLANLGSPTPAPTPVTPGPVVPSPAPGPTPVTPGTVNINTAQLMGWLKDALSILGTLGTWATAAHGMLGQFLPGTTGTAVPAALAIATTGFTAHNVHQKRTAQTKLAAKGG